jgi:hypothetical protein
VRFYNSTGARIAVEKVELFVSCNLSRVIFLRLLKSGARCDGEAAPQGLPREQSEQKKKAGVVDVCERA